MYYCPPPQEPPQTGMGIFPVMAAVAGAQVASGLFSTFFGSKDAKLQAKTAEEQIRAEKQLAVTQIESQQRADTVRALTIGGVAAVVIAGIFVIGAVRKKR